MAKSKWARAALTMAAVMVLTLSVGIASACTGQPEDYTVTFYDGTTVITTREVEEGGKVTEFEPVDVD